MATTLPHHHTSLSSSCDMWRCCTPPLQAAQREAEAREKERLMEALAAMQAKLLGGAEKEAALLAQQQQLQKELQVWGGCLSEWLYCPSGSLFLRA